MEENVYQSSSHGENDYKTFNLEFNKLDYIDEIGLTYTTEGAGSIQVVNRCIGVSQNALKQMFLFAYKVLMGKYAKKKNVIEASRCVVLLCPDCCTAWNIRKKLILKSRIVNMDRELNLTRLSLQLRPKSSEAFVHRRWILKRTFQVRDIQNFQPNTMFHRIITGKIEESVPVIPISKFEHLDWKIINNEIEVCANAASKHPSNYTAWSHKIWVVDNLIFPFAVQKHKSSDVFVKFLHQEFVNGLKLVEFNVSDFSCMSFVEHIILCLVITTVANPTNVLPIPHLTKIVLTAWDLSTDLLKLHSGQHESLWVFRRAIFNLYHKVILKLLNLVKNQNEIAPELSSSLLSIRHIFSYSAEQDFCRAIPDNCLRSSYLKYLKTYCF